MRIRSCLGADVKMKESYCWLTGRSNTAYVIEDARCDVRLGGHAARDAARSYVAVLLRDMSRTPWGTLCHFDFAPHPAPPGALAKLDGMRPLLEEPFVRDKAAEIPADRAADKTIETLVALRYRLALHGARRSEPYAVRDALDADDDALRRALVRTTRSETCDRDAAWPSEPRAWRFGRG